MKMSEQEEGSERENEGIVASEEFLIGYSALCRLIATEASRNDVEKFFERIQLKDQEVVVRLFNEWDRDYFSEECDADNNIIRREAVPIIKQWLQSASSYDVAIARKFLAFLTREKQKRTKAEKISSRLSTASIRSTTQKTARVSTKYGFIKPKPLTKIYTERHDPVGMFQFQPNGSGLKYGDTSRSTQPHTTPRGSAGTRLKNYCLNKNNSRGSVLSNISEKTSGGATFRDDEPLPYFPLINHHKNLYRDPAENKLSEEDEAMEDMSREMETIRPIRAHHKINYMPMNEKNDDELKENIQEEVSPLYILPVVAHHKTLYGQYQDTSRQDEESYKQDADMNYPTWNPGVIIAHHKSLYGQSEQPVKSSSYNAEGNSAREYSPRKGYHKQFYEDQPPVEESNPYTFYAMAHHKNKYAILESPNEMEEAGDDDTNTYYVSGDQSRSSDHTVLRHKSSYADDINDSRNQSPYNPKLILRNQSPQTDDDNVIRNQPHHLDDTNTTGNQSRNTNDINVNRNQQVSQSKSRYTEATNISRNQSRYSDDINAKRNETRQLENNSRNHSRYTDHTIMLRMEDERDDEIVRTFNDGGPENTNTPSKKTSKKRKTKTKKK